MGKVVKDKKEERCRLDFVKVRPAFRETAEAHGLQIEKVEEILQK